MDDVVGGSCPRCDGEIQPGVTECPDCGIPLLAPGEAPPAVEAEEAADPWGTRLDVVASIAAGVILVYFLACAVAALTMDSSGPDFVRYQRLQIATQVGEITVGGLLLVGAAATAVRRALRAEDWLPDRRSWLVELVVASAAVVVGLAATVAIVNEVAAGPEMLPGSFQVLAVGNRLGGLAIAALAFWLAAPER